MRIALCVGNKNLRVMVKQILTGVSRQERKRTIIEEWAKRPKMAASRLARKNTKGKKMKVKNMKT